MAKCIAEDRRYKSCEQCPLFSYETPRRCIGECEPKFKEKSIMKSEIKVISKKRSKILFGMADKLFLDDTRWGKILMKIELKKNMPVTEKLSLAFLIGRKFGEFDERSRLSKHIMDALDEDNETDIQIDKKKLSTNKLKTIKSEMDAMYH